MRGWMRVGDSVGQLKPSEDDDNCISQLYFITTFAKATILDTLG